MAGELHEDKQLAHVNLFIGRFFSEGTRRTYRQVVREFFQFVDNCRASEVTPRHLQTWRDSLLGRNKPSTVRYKLIIIWTLFEYLVAAGIADKNPADKKFVRLPPRSDGIAGRALSPAEVQHLLAGPDRSTVIGARDYALLYFMLMTSHRSSEVCSLRASSFTEDRGRFVLKIRVKGGWTMRRPIPKDLWDHIQHYLTLDSEMRQEIGDKDPYIFQSCSGHRPAGTSKPLSSRTVYKIVSKWARVTGVGSLSPHDLRRTAVTQALNLGLSYRQVQMMTGHRDPKTVMIYDHARKSLEQDPANFISYETGKRSPAMFARWKRRPLKRAGKDGCQTDEALYAVLVRSVRVRGKPRQKVVKYLGSIRRSEIGNPEERMNFWLTIERELKDIKVEEGPYKKIINTLSKVVPLPTEREVADALNGTNSRPQKT